jgi:hypothetical protein
MNNPPLRKEKIIQLVVFFIFAGRSHSSDSGICTFSVTQQSSDGDGVSLPRPHGSLISIISFSHLLIFNSNPINHFIAFLLFCSFYATKYTIVKNIERMNETKRLNTHAHAHRKKREIHDYS